MQSRLGLGTNIEIWLPSTDEPVQAESQNQLSVPSGGALGTALLVDDEPLVRAAAADMLTDIGYAVLEAASAEEAIRLIGGGLKPQLLVTDHLMTGMNGTDLARRVLSELPGTQVLLVSGYAESEGSSPPAAVNSQPNWPLFLQRMKERSVACPVCGARNAKGRIGRRGLGRL